MMLKVFSNILGARDLDLSKAIRFAVGHGARIISMSIGRVYSLHKESVDSSVKYAMSRNVLIVHAAGNDGRDLDAAGNT
jgi:subtilisin family serine protease